MADKHPINATWQPCPRCGIPYNTKILTGSRMAVDRDVYICATCGRLEAVRAMAGEPPIPPDDWPVGPDELGREYAALARMDQASTLEILRLDDLDPGDES